MKFEIGDRVVFTVLPSRPIGTIESSRMLGNSEYYYVRFDEHLGTHENLFTQHVSAKNLQLAIGERKDTVEGGFKAAKGIFKWKEGDEKAEETIRRIRGNDEI